MRNWKKKTLQYTDISKKESSLIMRHSESSNVNDHQTARLPNSLHSVLRMVRPYDALEQTPAGSRAKVTGRDPNQYALAPGNTPSWCSADDFLPCFGNRAQPAWPSTPAAGTKEQLVSACRCRHSAAAQPPRSSEITRQAFPLPSALMSKCIGVRVTRDFINISLLQNLRYCYYLSY